VRLDEAVAALADTLKKAKGVAVLCSGGASVEEQWLFAKALALVPSAANIKKYLVPHTGAGDGFLISADRNPNTRGAILTGLVKNLAATDLSGFKAAVDSGEIDTVLSYNEDVLAAGLTIADLKKITFISFGTHLREASQFAKIEIPLLTVFEKAGTFVNEQFRVQKFAAAVPGPSGTKNGVETLCAIVTSLGGKAPKQATADGVWDAMSAEIPQFKGMTFSNLPSEGQIIDASAFATEKFAEGKSLHYAPAGV
jgi:NADH-quinone oxidoreductase subunit G